MNKDTGEGCGCFLLLAGIALVIATIGTCTIIRDGKPIVIIKHVKE
jgi:hypothetical protein